MTHFNTARINEMLALQIGVIKDTALKLDVENMEMLERNLTALESAVTDTRSMMEGLPHRHQA